MSLQIELSSCSTFALYPPITSAFVFSGFDFSFASIEPMMRSEARRAPTTFLYATDSRLRSSRERSSEAGDAVATAFMYSTISSYRSACSASFAMYTLSADIVRVCGGRAAVKLGCAIEGGVGRYCGWENPPVDQRQRALERCAPPILQATAFTLQVEPRSHVACWVGRSARSKSPARGEELRRERDAEAAPPPQAHHVRGAIAPPAAPRLPSRRRRRAAARLA